MSSQLNLLHESAEKTYFLIYLCLKAVFRVNLGYSIPYLLPSSTFSGRKALG